LTSATDDFPRGGILIPVEPKLWSDQGHYLLRRERTTIGRGSDCDIRISHPTVSRVHAELSWTAGALLLTHLSPVNPTFVNGAPVAEPRYLRAGDIIEIADGVALRVELFGSGDDSPTEPRGRDVRRMYAVISADVFGYSRLVEQDDVETARRLEACFKIIRDRTEGADGRVVQVAGDGILLLFSSAGSAVQSAIAWQSDISSRNEALPGSRRMEFRVGINSGDILITPAGTMLGDAINIAARVQSIAPPGGIFVTGVVRDQLQGRVDLRFEYIRTDELKNLSREIRIYRVNF
jgi:class 3 adenylate cyclase